MQATSFPAAVRSTPATELESGDRFELIVINESGRFRVPETLPAADDSLQVIEDEEGCPLKASFDPDRSELVLSGFKQPGADAGDTVWLEYQSPRRFRLILEKGSPQPANGELAAKPGERITVDPEDWATLRGGERRPTLAELELALRAARLALHAGFDKLICLPLVRDMELLEHQIRTAKTVLRRLRGRAMLCDEVGLGKTIEAGLILSELYMRGLVRSVLVLVPPSLIEQWQGEMRRKFGLELTSHDDPTFRSHQAAAWSEFDRVIASTHTAKR